MSTWSTKKPTIHSLGASAIALTRELLSAAEQFTFRVGPGAPPSKGRQAGWPIIANERKLDSRHDLAAHSF